MTATETVTIERLGQKGEGIAMTPSGRVYVPYALPGESVSVLREGERGTLIGVLAPSPDRVAPFCPYFTRCGGCAVQTLAYEPYAAWKRGLLVAALSIAGVAAEVGPLVDAHGLGRRRATFHARTTERNTAEVGFMRARAHDIVAIEACPILDPSLGAALPAARAIADALAAIGKPLDILVTATDTGLDIDLRGPGKLGEAERQRLVAVALTHDLARLSNHGIIVVERRRPTLRMGTALLEPPPGAFLQATVAGEAALVTRVVAALAGAARVGDLFAGIGTFALRLAAGAEVWAYDSEAAALEALSKASRAPDSRGSDPRASNSRASDPRASDPRASDSRASDLRPVAIETRDLFRRPLQPDELARFDALVLDPPRAGAEAQMRAIAKAGPPLVASVACDVQSFARDAAILVAAGYRPEIITPIDQFRHSAHLEIVALFHRAPTRKKRRLLG